MSEGFHIERPSAAAAGAPSTADYLVGTADAALSAEIVVGTTPNGELGGTWDAITVDASHSGSTHAATQAAAEATAASALATHAGTSAASTHGNLGHAESHALDDSDHTATSDVTTLNSSTTAHGLLRKLDGTTTNFLRGDGAWAAPSGGPGGAADIEVTEQDFGSTPVTYMEFSVTDVDVTTASQIQVLLLSETPTALRDGLAADADEAEMEPMDLYARAESGSFTLVADVRCGPVTGPYKFGYLVG